MFWNNMMSSGCEININNDMTVEALCIDSSVEMINGVES